MRTTLISATIIVFVLILIVVFQNIYNSVNGVYFLFYYFTQNDSASSLLILMAACGFVAGTLSTMLITSLISAGKDEEAPGGSNW